MNERLESIWRGFADRLRVFVRSRVSDGATAEDILQEVFLKIHGGLPGLKDPARLEGWLFQVTRNAIRDYHRRRREHEVWSSNRHDRAAEAVAEEEEGTDVDLKPALRRFLDELPEAYREALVLTEFEGLTQEETARRLGLSWSGVKSRVQRGREKLRQMLLECCHLEFDRRGKVIDCLPRCDCCGALGDRGLPHASADVR